MNENLKVLFIKKILERIILIPLVYFVPKKKNRILLIARDGGRVLDNIKYLYIYLKENFSDKYEIVFFTKYDSLYKEALKEGIDAYLYKGIRSFFFLAGVNIVICDDKYWHSKIIYYLTFLAKKVQLWHGVGFKRIERIRAVPDFKVTLAGFLKSRLFEMIIPSYPEFDLLISTSEFYTKHLFKYGFRYKKIVETGYPRNDIMFRTLKNIDLINIDNHAYDTVLDKIREGYKIVLYAPTFRSREFTKVDTSIIDPVMIDKFSKKNKILFVFKFHPLPGLDMEQLKDYTDSVLVYDNSKDVYPLFPFVDLMITDYSSIYVDFLLQDRPVIFYAYDYEEYAVGNETFQFDYYWITPGVKCFLLNDVLNEIDKSLNKGIDEWAERREYFTKLSFKFKDGLAAERIFNEVRKEFKI